VSTLPERVIPVMIRSARTCCTASSCARADNGRTAAAAVRREVPSLCVDTCGPPHDGLAHVSKASIVPNRHPDVKELVRAGIDTLFAVRPVAVANGGLS
jgi:hypothetical protein